ncbi:MAG: ABC transporter substrate-binding protein, partial [Acidimicrobiia bacterium]
MRSKRATKPRGVILMMILGLVVGACGGTAATTTSAASAGTTTAPPATTAPAEATTTAGEDVTFDVGITEDTITVGLLADLSGPFSPLVQDIVAVQEVYWDLVNQGGGIAGRQIEVIVEDTAYNPDQHRTKYEAIRDQVALLS